MTQKRYTVLYGGFTYLETDDWEKAYEAFRLNGPYTELRRNEEEAEE